MAEPFDTLQDLIDADAAVTSAGNPLKSRNAITRLVQSLRPGGLIAGDSHDLAILKQRIADVVSAIS